MSQVDRPYLDRHQPATVTDSRWSDEPRQGLRPALSPDAVLFAPEAVQQAVEEAFCLPAGTLTSRDRTRGVSEARDAAYWLLRRHSRLSSVRLGVAMGRRDHASVLRAVERAERRRAEDAWYREQTDKVERELEQKAKGVAAA